MNDTQAVNILKGLVIDAVDKAKSGHPGGPMSSMDLTYILFTEFLKFDPDDPKWPGRDRFVLSAGHMSMLLYSQLYAMGWLNMDDLKQFRQLHSRTPGHPENFMTPGVECTTGPLGQGAAMSVGFAIAHEHLRSKFDRQLFDYENYALVSDGDLQEGVALGAAALAGHLKLGNLTWIFDSNDIQLSGPTELAESANYRSVFEGFGWRVDEIDGHDHDAIRKAYATAQAESQLPTLIIARTEIGRGCVSLAGSAKTHGSPLPADERTATRKNLGLPDEAFYGPKEMVDHYQRNFAERRETAQTWRNLFDAQLKDDGFRKQWHAHFDAPTDAQMPEVNWDRNKPEATRNSFGRLIAEWSETLPNLVGGSADLEPSNMTKAFADNVQSFLADNRSGRNLNYGVREFPMAAINNGMVLHGGIIPFDATFLSFADYSRPAIRLGAIQKVRSIHEFTHDSFHLGEDGPTHQPVEQVMALRVIPEHYVMRPADPVETEVLLRTAVKLERPASLCLTRQKVPYLEVDRKQLNNAARGAYVVHDTPNADLLIIATGSEVALAIDAAKTLSDQKIRVVSMPCWELFAEQDASYQDEVLPPSISRRVSIEAGTTIGWERWVGREGLTIGLDHYGASAPAGVLAKEYGFTTEAVVAKIKDALLK